MASKQVILYGSILEWSTDGVSYARIPEAKGLVVPRTTREYVEVTNLDSTGGYREYIKGLRDAGETDVLVGYTPAGYATALTYADLDDPIYIRSTMKKAAGYATADIFVFRAFIEPEVTADDLGAAVEFSLNMRVTGAPAHTPAVAS